MKPLVSLRDALADDSLLAHALPGDSWGPWRTLLIAAMGEPIVGDDELLSFRHLTERQDPPTERVEEFICIAGRRGGKTRAASTLAVYIAALCDHSDKLASGERALALLISQDQRNARTALGYARAVLLESPMLRSLIVGETSDSISLSNGIDLEVRAASFRRLRGFTAVCCIADESCFWATDDGSMNPDTEILASVRPALATTGGPLCIISTPYAKRGETWRMFSEHFGPEGDPRILVARGATRDLNPNLSQRVVDRALARDPEANRAEYLAEWRTDVSAFVDRAAVERCVEPDCLERPPERKHTYFGFVDPSGGSADSMTLAIAHRDGERIVIDALRETRAPFSPDHCVWEFAKALEAYRVTRISGDRYAGEWPRESFRKKGVTYEPAGKAKAELYVDLLPLINAGNIVLPDNPRLIAQLAGLERRVSRGGRDSIDHGPGAHDDIANAVAGAAWGAGIGRRGEIQIGYARGHY